MATSERPFKKHQVSTIFLRVPTEDWPYVIAGKRSEFRAAAGNAPQLWSVHLPTFAICYRKRKASGDYDWELMVLERIRQEKLAAISDEGLVAAGYSGPRDEAFARFRREIVLREKQKFSPSRNVFVYTVRKRRPEDDHDIPRAIVEHLYGEFFGAA